MTHLCFLFAFVVFLSAGTVSCGSVTYCQTPKDVQVGQQGTINCSFPESIRDKKFIVVRHGPSSTDNHERIVTCYNINGVRRCDVSRGYAFICTNEPLQTVVIPNVTKQHEGTFICRLIPSDPNDCKSCDLKVKEARILDSSQKQEGKARYNGDNDDNEMLQKEKPGGEITSTPTVIAGVVCGVGLVVGCVVGVQVYKIRNKATTCFLMNWMDNMGRNENKRETAEEEGEGGTMLRNNASPEMEVFTNGRKVEGNGEICKREQEQLRGSCKNSSSV